MHFILFLFLLIFGKSYSQCGKVLNVKDGDTFEILMAENVKKKVRLAYIDAPEHNQEFGEQSKKYLQIILYNKQVCLSVKYTDPYKRLVAIVKLKDGQNLNELLVKNGMAWHFTKYSKDTKLAKLQNEARLEGIGIWYNSNPTPPWEFRKQHHIGFQKRSSKKR